MYQILSFFSTYLYVQSHNDLLIYSKDSLINKPSNLKAESKITCTTNKH